MNYKVHHQRDAVDPPRVALVGCGKAKAAEPRQALQLYTGRLFRAAVDFAIATHDEVFIVSAKHGLLPLEQHVEPYDLSMRDLSPAARALWGDDVARALVDAMGGVRMAVTVLMGESYARWLQPALARYAAADGWPEARYPLHGVAGVLPARRRAAGRPARPRRAPVLTLAEEDALREDLRRANAVNLQAEKVRDENERLRSLLRKFVVAYKPRVGTVETSAQHAVREAIEAEVSSWR